MDDHRKRFTGNLTVILRIYITYIDRKNGLREIGDLFAKKCFHYV